MRLLKGWFSSFSSLFLLTFLVFNITLSLVMTKKKKHNPTIKQKALARKIIEAQLDPKNAPKNQTELVRSAGYEVNPNAPSNHVVAHRFLKNEAVQTEVQIQLKEMGLVKKANSKLSEILDLDPSDAKTLPTQLDAAKEIHKLAGNYELKKTEQKVVFQLPGV